MPYESEIFRHALIYGDNVAVLPIIHNQKKTSMLLADR